MGAVGNANNTLDGKLEEKRQRGRPSRRWEGNIRINLRKTEWGGVD
jgi:hypothetical protein